MSESMSDQGVNEGLLLTIGPLQIFDTIIISWGIILLLWLLVCFLRPLQQLLVFITSSICHL